jgi:hypothetical protein
VHGQGGEDLLTTPTKDYDQNASPLEKKKVQSWWNVNEALSTMMKKT